MRSESRRCAAAVAAAAAGGGVVAASASASLSLSLCLVSRCRALACSPARLSVFSHCLSCLFSQLRSQDCRSQASAKLARNSSQKAATSVLLMRC